LDQKLDPDRKGADWFIEGGVVSAKEGKEI
jgi:hypothetical protein